MSVFVDNRKSCSFLHQNIIMLVLLIKHLEGGVVAWWLRPRTLDPEVGSSSPARVAMLCP